MNPVLLCFGCFDFSAIIGALGLLSLLLLANQPARNPTIQRERTAGEHRRALSSQIINSGVCGYVENVGRN